MDNYYDIPAVSASGINTFLNDSPFHFWNSSAFNPNKEPTKETPALIFGRLTHCLLLEPENFDKDFFIVPETINKRTNVGKEEYAKLIADNEGKSIVTEDDYKKALEMISHVHNHSSAKQLLSGGEAEKEFFWDHTYTVIEEGEGVEKISQCKCKADYYREDGLVVDYKTIDLASMSNFQYAMTKRGYHRQAAWYLDGIMKATGISPKGFVFILQDKTLYKAIGVVIINAESINIGRQENAQALTEITERIESGNWSEFPNKIIELGLSHWYIRQFENKQQLMIEG